MLYAFLIIVALFERLVFDLGPNVELVTMATVLAGMFGRSRRAALLVPLIVMMISDMALGISVITAFTWSGFAVMGLVPRLLARVKSLYLRGVGSGMVGVLWFYVWTNWGVFVTDTFGMYEKSFNGLITCYINALPFLRVQMASAVISIGVGVFVYQLVGEVRDMLVGERARLLRA